MPEMELVDSVPAEAPVAEAAAPSPAPEATPAAPEPTAPEAPAADPITPDPAAAEPAPTETLYDLPDGRKVNAEGLQREYQNLLPEFTRKSQELAALKAPQAPITTEEPEWKHPDYTPKSWAEAIEIAKAEAIAELGRTAQAEAAQQAALVTEIDTQVGEIKKADPTLDENALFQHAVKYGFKDLRMAHANMNDMRATVKTTEAKVLKNLATRAADPIATTPTPTPGAAVPGEEYDPRANSNFRSATDFLDSLKR